MTKHALMAAAISILAGTAFAQPRTFYLAARVDMVMDASGILVGTVAPGDTIRGSYTYELSTMDSNSLPTVGDYWHHVSPYGISLDAGTYQFLTNSGDVQFLVEIVNNHGTPMRDNYLLRSYRNIAMPPLLGGAIVDHISWQLDDPTATALNSQALPSTPPVLGDWQSTFGLEVKGCKVDEFGDCVFDPSQHFHIRAHVFYVGSVPTAIGHPGWAPTLPTGVPAISAFPNPARGLVNVLCALEDGKAATLCVFDATGRIVTKLEMASLGNGRRATSWDGTDSSGRRAAAGAYFLRLAGEGLSETKRVVLVR
jgi:hypothetical protein